MGPIRQTRRPSRLAGPAGVLALLVAFLASAGSSARADDDRIWSALVLATDVEKPKSPPPELARVAGKIEKFFGYNQVTLIGSATKTIDDDLEHWLVPSQHFWVCVKSKRAGEDSYDLKLELFHDKRRLAAAEAKVGPDSPLLIRGRMHARGQLVIVLQVLP